MRLRAFMWQGVLTIFSSLGCTIALHIRVPFRKHNLRSAWLTNQAPRPSVAQKRLLQLKTFWEDSGNSYCHYNKSDDCLNQEGNLCTPADGITLTIDKPLCRCPLYLKLFTVSWFPSQPWLVAMVAAFMSNFRRVNTVTLGVGYKQWQYFLLP